MILPRYPFVLEADKVHKFFRIKGMGKSGFRYAVSPEFMGMWNLKKGDRLDSWISSKPSRNGLYTGILRKEPSDDQGYATLWPKYRPGGSGHSTYLRSDHTRIQHLVFTLRSVVEITFLSDSEINFTFFADEVL